jgi:nucleoside-diphosphate-sugar epimerase
MVHVRALVTGGAGFIGSNLVDALIGQDVDVVVLDDLSSGDARNVQRRAELIEGDVCDPVVAAKAVAGCEVIFHQAAARAVSLSVEQPLLTNQVNVTGTLNMLVAARDAGVRRFISASSSSIYGGAAQLPTPEDAPLSPRSPYAVSKLAGEHYCRVFHELFGLETVSLRYFNVYGFRQRPDSMYAAVIPLFIAALLSGNPVTVHGDGLQSRDFTSVADAVAANILAWRAPTERCAGRTYNVAGGAEHSLLDVLAVLRGLAEREPQVVHGDPRPGDVRHSRADIRAAARDLGFQPSVGLARGLALTWAWLAEQTASREG